MKRNERRLRDQQEVRQSILDAARQIALTEGWRGVTMRKIAEKIEYSHPMLYEYFANKEVLLFELLREGFRLLLLELQASQTLDVPATEAFKRLSHAYWQFAWRYPELYRVMNGLDGVSFAADAAEAEAQAITNLFIQSITAVCEGRAQRVPPEYVLDQVYLCWSSSHGVISLALAGRIVGGKEHAFALYEQGITDYLYKWENLTPSQ
jgi:AcrR family transcriptional regulator